jgi:hypothetical protein
MQRRRASYDGRCRQRAEVAAVQTVGIGRVEQQQFARAKRAAALPDGQRTAEAVVHEGDGDRPRIDAQLIADPADALLGLCRDML